MSIIEKRDEYWIYYKPFKVGKYKCFDVKRGVKDKSYCEFKISDSNNEVFSIPCWRNSYQGIKDFVEEFYNELEDWR